MPTIRRAEFIIVNMQRRPLWGSPISQPLAPSKFITQVAEPLMPILCSSPPQKAGLRLPSARNLGTRNSEIPFTPAGASGRRASTRWTMFSTRSCSPPVIQIFVPLSA